jgi:O-antigen ligase
MRPTIGDRYLTWHVWVLLGYALLGKGFAYLGFAPLYVGEVTLALGLLAWVLNRNALKVFGLFPALLLATFMLWGCVRTLPYYSIHGMDALRDAVTWGYGFFALIVATLLIAKPERLRVLIERYRRFVFIFAALMPVSWLLTVLYSTMVPHLFGSPEPIVNIKGGDTLVHLAGSVAFVLSGLGTASLFLIVMTFTNFFLSAFMTRGGMFAFLGAVALVALLRPLSPKLWRLLIVGLLVIVVFGASGLSVQFPGEDRELSFEQIVANLSSASGDTNTGDLEETKDWRLQWWDKIVDYTFYGNYFWTGKGYGVNLANEDGFQVDVEDESLRSPHNGTLTILARSGVPGLVLWGLVQLSWFIGMLVGYYRSRVRQETRWAGVFLFLLAYWTAFMLNFTFDVSLEGPMAGIWFWTLYGVGLAAMWIYKYHPWTLSVLQRTSLPVQPLSTARPRRFASGARK